MTDKMEFPKTMREFIDNYSFKDIEEVYTNGAELVPVFRVEQALEHYEKEIRNKAIDDFVENISLKISESLIWGMIADCFKYQNMNDTSDKIVDYVINTANEIAEQLKVGEKNEQSI